MSWCFLGSSWVVWGQKMCALITDVTGKVKYIQDMGGFPPKNVFAPPPLLCHLCIHSSLESHIRGDSVYSGFPPPFPICTDLLKGVLGACFLPFTWGLMAGLQGFASHGNSLFLGAGCQQWKLLDISGPQLPLCDAVANYSQLSPCGHPAITDTPIIRTAAKSPAQTNTDVWLK